MSKILVAYFSASGSTAKVAKNLAAVTGADIFEIKPQKPYTGADLNWNDKNSRSTVEMEDPASRPKLAENISSVAEYGTIFVGFPIWWYTAPHIIKTFLESNDLSGKQIIIFATSGGSGLGKTAADLRKSCAGAEVISGKVFRRSTSENELKDWVKSLSL